MTDGAELLFSRAPAPDGALLFGETDAAAGVSAMLDLSLPGLTVEAHIGHRVEAQIDLTLPGLVVDAWLSTPVRAALDMTLPGLTVEVALNRTLDVSRPTVGQTRSSHQQARCVEAGVESRREAPQPLRPGVEARHQQAVRVQASVQEGSDRMRAVRSGAAAGHAEALPLRASVQAMQANMLRQRQGLRARHQDGSHVRASVGAFWQERIRLRSSARSSAQTARPVRLQVGQRHATAAAVRVALGARHQEAMRPPPGWGWRPGVTPPFDPCYLPDAALLFSGAAGTDGSLLFICDLHGGPDPVVQIVVPVRRVYMIENTVALRRLGSSVDLPASSFSIELDEQSWAWGFSASLAGEALDAVSPDLDGSPAVLVASINGEDFRVFVEGRNRSRSFGKDIVAVTGRGINAVLDSPYDPVATFRNSAVRTAQQLMADVLTDNGVPMGWAVDWQLDDWLVPAGAWSAQGSRMSALLGIAAAAGGYIQPHPTDQTLRVLHRYPVAPWLWGTLTPDIVLPADVATQEGIEWVRKSTYNRVFVSGQGVGVRGEVTRDGTAGDLAAPSIVDSLITAVEAAQQRGRAILSDTGNQARVRLRLPVLSETGVILPGKTVRYSDADGTTRFGIVRSTSVDAEFPEVWQSIGVETHV